MGASRDFLTFFPAHLCKSDPPTDFDAKWLKRRAFTQGCAFCSKNRNFSYPLISRAPKRSKFCKSLDLENFRSMAFNIGGHGENTPYSLSELNESDIVNSQSGGEKSHAHTVVWECCKDDRQSQWGMAKCDPQPTLNPWTDRHQIWNTWLRRGYLPPPKIRGQSARGFLPPTYVKYCLLYTSPSPRD